MVIIGVGEHDVGRHLSLAAVQRTARSLNTPTFKPCTDKADQRDSLAAGASPMSSEKVSRKEAMKS